MPSKIAGTLVALLVSSLAAHGFRSTGSNPTLTADAVVPDREHSLFSPYVDSTLQNKFWDYGGDAIVDTNRYVILTQDRHNESGWLWSRLPIDMSDFEITVEFTVKGQSVSTGGDGFAMWLTKERMQGGPIFGNRNRWNGLGIIFDTFPNAPHRGFFPQISVVKNNGQLDYNLGKDGEDQDIAHCNMQLRRTPTDTRLRFTYIKDVYMELALQTHEWNKWASCFRISPYEFTGQPYLGFSASTGDVSDLHAIGSVWTNKLVYHSRTPADLENERLQAFSESSGTGWWNKKQDEAKNMESATVFQLLKRLVLFFVWVIKWLVILAVLGAAGYFGNKYYQQKKVPSTYKNRRMMA
ncbi:unnamed protein product [Malassezia sympodialis ATCC 42132]|uniref:Uncharacterized protein n=1 Tax=Malassezia sympodialis (strain ATCC 42132) TaxID=1230383 RepID=M5ED66_MALS4|nr:uncharacterized protein MSY001_3282 [Malassezia sympodialis ATCC 42132]CCV00577.1 unnamed protein product [Malassezia sympodialis ATCC 42132]SHO79747.1 Similar to S.cerevisiae protein UIP5 (Protein of unknown function that interacts with Ulp1p) [Malassezia sympodialis ATCC 42132]|eukprot:XP_018741763.1 uncharacterized protein MSY001_3282 [Malassezia sympodialis ATCC 42132]